QSLVVFDATPPRQYTGAQAYRKDFEDFFAAFPGAFSDKMSDLDVTIGGEVAYGHNIQHVVSTDKNGKMLTANLRVTDGYQRINHEHFSLPVDLATMKPVLESQ